MKKTEKELKQMEKFISLIAEVIPNEDAKGKKLKMEQRIRIAAATKLPSKYNLNQNKAAKESFNLHKEICSSLVEISEKYNVPCCYCIYFMVGKDAHKIVTFNKGYKKLNVEKGEAIIRMAQAYAKKCDFKANDAAYHAFTTYYEQGNTDADNFINNVLPTLSVNSSNGFQQICSVLGIKGRGMN